MVRLGIVAIAVVAGSPSWAETARQSATASNVVLIVAPARGVEPVFDDVAENLDQGPTSRLERPPPRIAATTGTNNTPPRAPEPPRQLSAVGGHQSITLAWLAPTDNGGAPIGGYRIENSLDGMSWSWVATVTGTGGTDTTYVHRGLRADQLLHYRVQAINSVGRSRASVAAIGITLTATLPTAPDGLTAMAMGAQEIGLSWMAPLDDGGKDILGYRVESSTDGSAGSWNLVLANTGTPSLTYTHTRLLGMQTVHYRVAAVTAAGTSAFSNEVMATTEAATSPDPPQAVAAVGDRNEITLTWAAPLLNGGAEITGYRVESADSENGSWTALVADSMNTNTSYRHHSLGAARTVYYRVAAINSATHRSEWSSVASATTATALASGPPSVLVFSTRSTEVDLSLIAPVPHPDGGPLYQYIVEQSSTGVVGSWTADGDPHEQRLQQGQRILLTRSGFQPAQTAYLRVRVVSFDGGPSPPSAVVRATTKSRAPENLQAIGGDQEIALRWTAPTVNNGAAVTGYQIERFTGSNTWEVVVVDTGNSNTRHVIDGLMPNQTVRLRVAAINAGGPGETAEVEGTTLPVGVPTRPKDLRATGGNLQIRLTWRTPDSDGGATVTGYRIEQSDTGATNSWTTLVSNSSSVMTSYIHLQLAIAQRSFYRVAAVNSQGAGEFSNVAVATTNLAPPTVAPTNLTVLGGRDSIALSWVAPTGTGAVAISGYRIEYSSINTANQWTDLVANTNTTQTTFTHSDPGDGVDVTYRVSAVNSGGTGPPSATATAQSNVARPSAPRGPLEIAIITDRVEIMWQAPLHTGANSDIHYRIDRALTAPSNWITIVNETEQDVLQHSDDDVAIGMRVYYRVFAINDGAAGANTSIPLMSDGVDIGIGRPDPPRDFRVEPGLLQITLMWRPAPAGTIDGLHAPIQDYVVEFRDENIPAASFTTLAGTENEVDAMWVTRIHYLPPTDSRFS